MRSGGLPPLPLDACAGCAIRLSSGCGRTSPRWPHPRRDGQTLAFEATARVNRHDFDLTWNMLQEGLQIVGDDIDITIQIEANTPRQR